MTQIEFTLTGFGIGVGVAVGLGVGVTVGFGVGFAFGIVTVLKMCIRDSSYQKVSYVNGVMYGHNGYNLGNSLLIVGDLAGVTIKNADKTGNDENTVYDRCV